MKHKWNEEEAPIKPNISVLILKYKDIKLSHPLDLEML